MIKIIKNFGILFNKRQKSRLFLLFLITLVGAFLEILGVSLMIPMVSAIMKPEIISTNVVIQKVCQVFGVESHRTFVILCIVALIAVFAIKNIFLLFEYYVQAKFVYNSRFQTQKQVFHSFLCRQYEFFLNTDSGSIMRDINGNVQEVYSLLMTLMHFATESIVSLALFITVFIIDSVMTSCIAIMMGLIVILITKVVKPILSRKGEESRKHNAIKYRWLLQAIEGIKEVKVNRKEQFFEDSYIVSGKKVLSAEKWKNVLSETPHLLIEAGCVCSVLVVIACMIYKGKSLDDLFPALTAFAMAAIKLMPSANRIVNAVNDIAFHGPALEKLSDHMKNMDVTIKNVGDGKPKLTLNDKIELKNIVYHYPNTKVNVLDEADMVIPVGTSVGIAGKSGAGKTTVVDVMLGLLTPNRGVVTTDGVDVMTNYSNWLSHIGYIPQSIFMLNDTIRSNVAFGNNLDDDKVWNALEAVQLADFIRELPNQLDTNIGERGIRMSGGQRQRLGIARALYNDPELLVFDEATSSLDGETEKAIMESINGFHGKKTIVIIAHRLQTIERCDAIYRVQNGKITLDRGILRD